MEGEFEKYINNDEKLFSVESVSLTLTLLIQKNALDHNNTSGLVWPNSPLKFDIHVYMYSDVQQKLDCPICILTSKLALLFHYVVVCWLSLI